MTCILGYKYNNHIWMIADSASSHYTMSYNKIWKSGEFFCGLSGTIRSSQVFKHLFDPKDIDLTNDMNIIMYDVCEQFKQIATANGIAHVDHSIESVAYGDNPIRSVIGLIGIKNNLFYLCGDFAYIDVPDVCLAVGSGAPEALGASAAYLESKHYVDDPVGLLTHSMNISCKYNIGEVRPPFIILSNSEDDG